MCIYTYIVTVITDARQPSSVTDLTNGITKAGAREHGITNGIYTVTIDRPNRADISFVIKMNLNILNYAKIARTQAVRFNRNKIPFRTCGWRARQRFLIDCSISFSLAWTLAIDRFGPVVGKKINESNMGKIRYPEEN